MLELRGKIHLSDSGNSGSLSNVTSSIGGNNISENIASVINNHVAPTYSPFLLGYSRVGGNDRLMNSAPFFIGSESSNNNGKFTNTYTITLTGSSLESVIIKFNTLKNEHPNSVIVDGETYYDDDAQFEIKFPTVANNHIIAINNWNTPNSVFVIESIILGLDIEINNDNLISYNDNINQKSDLEYPVYAVISNKGSLVLHDYDEKILDLITRKILHSNVKVEISLYDSTADTSTVINKYQIQSLSYDNENKECDIALFDNLEQLQEINVNDINYIPTVSTSKPLSYIYTHLYNITVLNGFDMLSLNELDSDTKSILENTQIEYPVLESSNLWDEWNKLCEATLSNMYIDKNNKIIFKHKV